MKGKILNYLHDVEKIFSVISVQIKSEKLDFPSLKKYTSFAREKIKFFAQSLSLLKLAKLNFHF